MGGTFNGAVPSIAGGTFNSWRYISGAVPSSGRYFQWGDTFNSWRYISGGRTFNGAVPSSGPYLQWGGTFNSWRYISVAVH